MLDGKTLETLRDAAAILAGSHDGTTQDMLETMFIRMAETHNTSGKDARSRWKAVLRALGEMCISLAKMID